MLGKMPGDRWQKFANLRAYYGFMWGHPGKKLLFMGGEFAQKARNGTTTSRSTGTCSTTRCTRDCAGSCATLNAMYRAEPGLHQRELRARGIRLDRGGDADNNVFSFIRYGNDGAKPVVVVANMAPVLRETYRIGVPWGGTWSERLNTDRAEYGGSGAANGPLSASDEGDARPAAFAVAHPSAPRHPVFLTPD